MAAVLYSHLFHFPIMLFGILAQFFSRCCRLGGRHIEQFFNAVESVLAVGLSVGCQGGALLPGDDRLIYLF